MAEPKKTENPNLGVESANTKDHTQKHISVIVFVILGIIIIIYVIYLFEAYQKDMFPFKTFVLVIPPNAVQPLGTVSKLSADDISVLKDKASQAEVDNCNFYNNAAITIKLPEGQKPLGGCSAN